MRLIAILLLKFYFLSLTAPTWSQNTRRLGRFQEVFAWRQLTYNINGNMVIQDRFGDEDIADDDEARARRQADSVFFDNQAETERNWNEQPGFNSARTNPPSWRPNWSWDSNRPNAVPSQRPASSTTTVSPTDEAGRFFIQYNNVPMGVERVGNRLFVTVPRRRHGIPSTLNYLDLTRDSNTRSPPLRPYPNLRLSRSLISVYRTRADQCGRLWMVDTGLLEIPNSPQQLQPPAIVIFDLTSNRQILRYPFKSSDIPAANTPTGLASITVDIVDEDCRSAYAYVPDLTTFGLIVYSLRDNDSWRLTHSYFHFNPTAGNLMISGQRFQWSDGIFSITLTNPGRDGCRLAYFHPMVSTQEFSVSTCVLRNRTSAASSNYWSLFSLVGERGEETQSTMHQLHASSGVMFFAEIGRNAVSCWNTGQMLSPANIAILAQDSVRMSYPADLHITGDEVWVMANTLPRFGYSRLNTDEYNFYIYRGNVQELISGTSCAAISSSYSMW